MDRLLILGLGYSAGWIAAEARAAGLKVIGVRRQAADGILSFDDPALPQLVVECPFLISSVPPEAASGRDPVLERFAPGLARRQAAGRWSGYLSSTGVYGDTAGAFVDEAAPVGTGRRSARTEADLGWQGLGATIFRLPGIYGPGRSALDQVRAGTARRVDRPGHRFNRIHVADIAGAVVAALGQRATGIFNIVDAHPAEPRAVTEWACLLLGAPLPDLRPIDLAGLSPMAASFWTEQRCVTGRRMARILGYRLRHPDYKSGLQAILAQEGRGVRP